MQIFYNPRMKKTGMPLKVITGKSEIYTGLIQGSGDLVMAYNPKFKLEIGKSCVLDVQNFKEKIFDKSRIESFRIWFCKGNFKRSGLENKPVVITDHKGKSRDNKQQVILKNCEFEVEFNNAISSEKNSGATTILKIFSYERLV